MPSPPLPDTLVLPTRADLVAQWKSDVNFRAPGVSTDVGTLPDIDANVAGDLLLPVFVESSRQADAATLAGQNSAQLDQTCKDFGLPTKLPAVGASGFVQVTTSVGGANIASGQEIRNLVTGFRYTVSIGGVYNSTGTSPNNLVPVVGVDTGPSTNVTYGTTLTWTSPPPGLLTQAAVFENSDGSGLSGGADIESDDEQRARIRNARAFPAVSGNDAAYQLAATQTPGLAIGAAFTYPACLGAGTTCLVFLLRPASPGAGRIPNTAQIALVRANVIGQMPKDDSASFGVVLSDPVDLKLGVVWAPGAASWTDGTGAWPPSSGGSYDYKVSAVTDATHFTISTTDPGAVKPQAGQTIGFFVLGNLVSEPDAAFVRKRILSVTGANPWVIVCDTANNASDTTFTPAVNDRAMPWSDSLAALVPAITSYFDALGPGEQFATFFDAGYRQRRSPSNPASWPSVLTNKALVPIEELTAIEDVAIASPSTPRTPAIGTPGVSAYVLMLRSFSVYPKA